jgi:tetratricopeptide (TPR) repeat protein
MTKARRAIDRKDYTAGEQYCNEQLLNDPLNTDALRLKAFATSMRGALEEAIQAIAKVIEITSGSPESADYFDQGRWLLEVGRIGESISAFSRVVELSKTYDDSYYLSSAYLHRAVAYHRAAQKEMATSDLQHVSHDCSCYALGSIHTRETLLSEMR